MSFKTIIKIILYIFFQIVRKNTQEVLESKKFLTLSPKSLELIIRQENFNLDSEIPLLEAVVKWAKAQCEEQNLTPTFQNKMDILEKSKLLPSLRSLIVTPAELKLGHARSAVFISEEMSELLISLSPNKYTIIKSYLRRYNLQEGRRENRSVSYHQKYVKPRKHPFTGMKHGSVLCRNTRDFRKYKIRHSVASDTIIRISNNEHLKTEYFTITTSRALLITSVILTAQKQTPGFKKTSTYMEDTSVRVRKFDPLIKTWGTVGNGRFVGEVKYGGHFTVQLQIEEEDGYVEICTRDDKLCVEVVLSKPGLYPLFYSAGENVMIQPSREKGIVLEVGCSW